MVGIVVAELIEEPRQADMKGEKPRGAKPGTRVVQGSKVDPQRFPDAGRDPKADVTIWLGQMRRRKLTGVPHSKVRQLVERQAQNKVKAQAVDAMSGDLIAASFPVRKIGKPERWTSWSTV